MGNAGRSAAPARLYSWPRPLLDNGTSPRAPASTTGVLRRSCRIAAVISAITALHPHAAMPIFAGLGRSQPAQQKMLLR